MPKSAVKVIVSGLVQGVGFRYFVYREATQLGVDGYVRNLATGQVEALFCGEKGLIDEMIKAVRVGPRHASVEHIHLEEITPPANVTGFTIQ
jgi:acylphosphatase